MRFWYPLVACLAVSVQAETPLRLAGSTTVKNVIEPHLQALETAAARPIQISATGSVTGLASLALGSADVAMVSLPIEEAVQSVNAKNPGRVDPGQLHVESVGETSMVFIVNPHNPVRSLTGEQLGAVLSGATSNWKALGGPDEPIHVIVLGTGGALLDRVLHGRPLVASSRPVSNASQIAVIVAQDPQAIGLINATHPRGQTSVLQTDVVFSAPLLLVTKGEPSEPVRKLIAAYRQLSGQPTALAGTR